MTVNSGIGKKVKELRTGKKYTLKILGDLTGLSTGFLSQLERGMTTVAIDSLGKIAEALEVELSYFFTTEREKDESFIVRSYERKAVSIGPRFIQYNLTDSSYNKAMLARIMDLMPMIELTEKTSEFRHEGEEFVFVLEGVFTISIDNVQHDLFPGDSVYIDSNHPHNWKNNTGKLVKLLVINTPNPLFKED